MAGSDGKWSKKKEVKNPKVTSFESEGILSREPLTKEQQDEIKKNLKEKAAKIGVPDNINNIYILGKQDPIKKYPNFTLGETHSSWAGVDIQVWIDDQLDGCLQSIDLTDNFQSKRKFLTVSTILLDTFDYPFWADGNPHDWRVFAVNEYGKEANYILGRFRVTCTNIRFSVDDIVMIREYHLESP